MSGLPLLSLTVPKVIILKMRNMLSYMAKPGRLFSANFVLNPVLVLLNTDFILFVFTFITVQTTIVWPVRRGEDRVL